MKSSAISLDKEYMEFADMTPAEITKWLHDLVSGLKKMNTRETAPQQKRHS